MIEQTDESGITDAITTLAPSQPTTTAQQPQTGRQSHFVNGQKRKGKRRTIRDILGEDPQEPSFQSMPIEATA